MLETLIAALAALGVGGIAGGWLAARRERAEVFRRHMVATCIAFLRKQAEARAALADTQAEVLEYMASADSEPLGFVARRDRLENATGKLRELQTQSFLLDLFFPRSNEDAPALEDVASAFAGNVVIFYWRWHDLLNRGLKGELDRPELRSSVDQLRESANDQHQSFCWVANRAIRGRAF